MDELTRRGWNPSRQCVALNREGERCRRQPIPGGNVCTLHGGRAPQTVAAAKRRLLAGADLAIDYLLSMLEPRPPCAACGRSDDDKDPVVVKACQLVLDRAGLHPTLTVQHEATSSPLSHLSSSELAERAKQLWLNAQGAIDEEVPRLLPEAEDGVFVEEEPIQEPVVQNPVGSGSPEKSIGD